LAQNRKSRNNDSGLSNKNAGEMELWNMIWKDVKGLLMEDSHQHLWSTRPQMQKKHGSDPYLSNLWDGTKN
jgi:hypothetical protein